MIILSGRKKTWIRCRISKRTDKLMFQTLFYCAKFLKYLINYSRTWTWVFFSTKFDLQLLGKIVLVDEEKNYGMGSQAAQLHFTDGFFTFLNGVANLIAPALCTFVSMNILVISSGFFHHKCYFSLFVCSGETFDLHLWLNGRSYNNL